MNEVIGPQSACGSGDVELLQIRRERPRERVDAARNRSRILAAARALFAEHGVEQVSMDQVAAVAGVGKGTLFRRFGDKAGLAAGLLDERERQLQESLLFGPPPLGPGAGPTDRLIAFLSAYQDYLDDDLPLVLMSETASPGARFRVGAYRFWHRHITLLLSAARADLDAELLAHTLLATISAEVYGALSRDYGPRRTRNAVTTLSSLILTGRG